MNTTKVFLREKKIKNGRKSLYLDFYPPIVNPKTGEKTRREFLGMYILEKARHELDKQNNKETKILAETIRAKRQLELQAKNHGFKTNTDDKDFLLYFRQLTNDRYNSLGNYGNWLSTYRHLQKFEPKGITFKDIDQYFVEDFKAYLNHQDLKANTIVSYYKKLVAALKQAVKDGYLDENPSKYVKGPKAEDTSRNFLTLEEIKKLIKTDCESQIYKNAFLFSAFSGLRFSDIKGLKWKDVQGNDNDGYYIRFTQKKTKDSETLPLSNPAINLIGERGKTSDPVFKGLKYSAYNNTKLKNWIAKAGIDRKITFHSARHSFATLQLTLGTDIYTVSKLLGHKQLKTTQIYAKIIDQTKTDAIGKLNNLDL